MLGRGPLRIKQCCPFGRITTSRWATLAALVDPSVTLPSPRRQSLSLYRQAFAQELEKDLANLEEALTVVAREVREAEATLSAKNTALRAHNDAYARTTAWLAGACELAGLAELAAKVRPVRRVSHATTPEPGKPADPAPVVPPTEEQERALRAKRPALGGQKGALRVESPCLGLRSSKNHLENTTEGDSPALRISWARQPKAGQGGGSLTNGVAVPP
jgi:hypothetical protein